MYKIFFKRIIDCSLSILGLIVSCIPMVIIAIAIKMDSKGPVFFKQRRLGKGTKPFTVYKFRTMCDHAYEMGGLATSASDSRITKVGGFLRRTSLDELPQMFNVLNGTMAAIEKYRIDCNCRKPKTGMFMQAVNDYHINLSKSYVLGDKLRDCAICNEYDCTGFIIGGQYSSSPQDAIRAKFLGNLFYVKDFLDAVHFIITNN